MLVSSTTVSPVTDPLPSVDMLDCPAQSGVGRRGIKLDSDGETCQSFESPFQAITIVPVRRRWDAKPSFNDKRLLREVFICAKVIDLAVITEKVESAASDKRPKFWVFTETSLRTLQASIDKFCTDCSKHPFCTEVQEYGNCIKAALMESEKPAPSYAVVKEQVTRANELAKSLFAYCRVGAAQN